MSQQTIQEKSAVIRNETQPKANTRGRVADVIDDINETKANKEDIEASFAAIESGQEAQDSLINDIKNNVLQQSEEITVLSNNIIKKLDKPTVTVTSTTTYTHAVLVDSNGNSAKYLAGDLGKNVANSSLTSVSGAGLTLGANWTLNTTGFYYSITGLPDGSNDSTVSLLLGQNSAGRVYKTNGKEIFKKLPTILTKAEKDQWGLDWNNQYSNGSLNVYSITPTVIKNDHVVRYLVLQGLNLNINPASTSVKFIPVGSPLGTNEVDCLGFQPSTDGKSMIISVYGDTLTANTQYNIIIRTISPIIQTHRTASNINVVTNIDSIDVSSLNWTKIAYTNGQENTIFTTNGGIFSYSSNTANKAYAYEPNLFVGAIKSDILFPANTNFYLEFNLSLSFSGSNLLNDVYDFYGYMGLLISNIPLSLADNTFIRIVNSNIKSGGYFSTVMWNNIVTLGTRIEPGTTNVMNANIVIMRQGNVYTQFLTVGSNTLIQTVTSNTDAVCISLAVTNGSTQKSISGSIVQAFKF